MIDAAPPPEPGLPALYREHRGWLEAWLRRRMGNAWDAADLSQDTFLRILASAQPLADIREPRAYLLTVGKRLLSNFHQRRSLEQAYLDALAQLPEQHVPSPEQRWVLLETLQALDELLDGLKPAIRKAFLWSQLEGLGYAEIGQRLGVCQRSVKRYMAQAYEHCLLADLQ
ncbi:MULTISPECIES: sigma-70 family RNA polymerase sigma factor [Pseudomonas]|uniref:sigma-70 family RNA polymerase sigma factor n=1 Tax=Pseudomonas TaxID=286 RepID=UPI001AE8B2CC|nr:MULTISPECIES: sigma-70 family RNA polymerase sigma factor [unclassified Pseudomonas]MBP2271053.1 RNA polymerase sigma-70 factor (ECF subfamily) [Pseudomonas sp. BP6]MBP2289976.1 RNA polymerase sigma-70 factor (ECF subfamily) [Pseudomonas sp. BP7]HDS1697792.1 sigma-70 family RNA polymerase sigma factor [Pseudomonas putida]HDS1700590.1 sigma-70 family RNA polymerase sigma factor [Pseudomonas putida]